MHQSGISASTVLCTPRLLSHPTNQASFSKKQNSPKYGTFIPSHTSPQSSPCCLLQAEPGLGSVLQRDPPLDVNQHQPPYNNIQSHLCHFRTRILTKSNLFFFLFFLTVIFESLTFTFWKANWIHLNKHFKRANEREKHIHLYCILHPLSLKK